MGADYIDRTPVDRMRTAVLAVDPGVAGTGWALWRSVKKGQQAPNHPDEVGVLTPRGGTFVEKSNAIADELHVITGRARWLCAVHRVYFCGCGKQPHVLVACEFPEFQAAAHRMMGWKRGDLQKLTYLVGAVGYMAYGMTVSAVLEPVPVSQWKGQLPKAVVTDRIREALGSAACGQLAIKTHAWDAVGIGLWRLGVFD